MPIGRRDDVDGSIRHNCQFEGDAFWNAQSMKADERWAAGVMCSDRRILKINGGRF